MRESFFTESELQNLREITIEEIRELIGKLESACGRLETGDNGDGFRREACLVFHTIAGSAGIVGFEKISDLGAEAESLFNSNDPPAPIDPLDSAREFVRRIEEMLLKIESTP